jgi:hypothetical protein
VEKVIWDVFPLFEEDRWYIQDIFDLKARWLLKSNHLGLSQNYAVANNSCGLGAGYLQIHRQSMWIHSQIQDIFDLKARGFG